MENIIVTLNNGSSQFGVVIFDVSIQQISKDTLNEKKT